MHTFVFPDQLILDAFPERVLDILKSEVALTVGLHPQILDDFVEERIQIVLFKQTILKTWQKVEYL